MFLGVPLSHPHPLIVLTCGTGPADVAGRGEQLMPYNHRLTSTEGELCQKEAHVFEFFWFNFPGLVEHVHRWVI